MKKREPLLASALLLVTIGYLKYLVLPLMPSIVNLAYGSYPDWFPVFAALVVVVGILTLKELWSYRRLGLYLFSLTIVAWLPFDRYVFDLHPIATAAYFLTVVYVVTVFLIYRRKFS